MEHEMHQIQCTFSPDLTKLKQLSWQLFEMNSWGLVEAYFGASLIDHHDL
jgi:hypothetical protein